MNERHGTDASDAPRESPGGRYQRSTNGLVGALVVTLVAIGAFVLFRAVTRDDLETEPVTVDYREQAGLAQDAGLEVAYPEALPQGWRATSVVLTPGDRSAWGLGLLTEDQQYIGIRQEDESLPDLLETYLDEETTERSEISVPGSVSPRWQAFEDDGGDLGYAAELGGQTVLVYGSADEEDLLLVLERLTTEPVG